MSLGAPAISSYKNDPLCVAVRRLVDAGVVVVAAAGNDGKDAFNRKQYGAIHAPVTSLPPSSWGRQFIRPNASMTRQSRR